ncbi:hypothetical protein QBC40DRAFT_345031 [Triangularia verruculosa]|uniref:Uncharacterized protein n=1 Tax=Triangularia verruculosa TaxID=2587418 RepID=A0AAN6XQA1_9PEZI|nr:hypothetical protein QBC40DRAFT_345031 [Triangularia verruculosa]
MLSLELLGEITAHKFETRIVPVSTNSQLPVWRLTAVHTPSDSHWKELYLYQEQGGGNLHLCSSNPMTEKLVFGQNGCDNWCPRTCSMSHRLDQVVFEIDTLFSAQPEVPTTDLDGSDSDSDSGTEALEFTDHCVAITRHYGAPHLITYEFDSMKARDNFLSFMANEGRDVLKLIARSSKAEAFMEVMPERTWGCSKSTSCFWLR